MREAFKNHLNTESFYITGQYIVQYFQVSRIVIFIADVKTTVFLFCNHKNDLNMIFPRSYSIPL